MKNLIFIFIFLGCFGLNLLESIPSDVNEVKSHHRDDLVLVFPTSKDRSPAKLPRILEKGKSKEENIFIVYPERPQDSASGYIETNSDEFLTSESKDLVVTETVDEDENISLENTTKGKEITYQNNQSTKFYRGSEHFTEIPRYLNRKPSRRPLATTLANKNKFQNNSTNIVFRKPTRTSSVLKNSTAIIENFTAKRNFLFKNPQIRNDYFSKLTNKRKEQIREKSLSNIINNNGTTVRLENDSEKLITTTTERILRRTQRPIEKDFRNTNTTDGNDNQQEINSQTLERSRLFRRKVKTIEN